MNEYNGIRELAKSPYWQFIYRNSKELANFKIFENETNFSGLQIIFLHYCEVYNMLYKELSENQWSNLTEDVINDDFRTDCFLAWRNAELTQEIKKIRKDQRKMKNKSENKFTKYSGPRPGKINKAVDS